MKIRNHLINNKAFTLIELVLGLLITSIIGGIIAGSYVAGTKIKSKQNDTLETQQNIRVAMYVLSRELKLAGFSLDPNWNTSDLRNLNVITGTADQSSITFQYMVDGQQDVNWDGNPDNGESVQVTYAHNPLTGNLTRTVTMLSGPFAGAATVQTITSNISDITFSYFNDDGTQSGNRNWVAAPATIAPGFTYAVGITIVAQNNNNDIDPTLPVVVRQFVEPYTGTAYATPADQIRRRMASSVVNLRNIIF